jgi:uncharacterized membrane-anchored protein YhcB (DUF1043 family)
LLPRATGDVLTSIAATAMDFSTEPLPPAPPRRQSWLWIVIGGVSAVALLIVVFVIGIAIAKYLPASNVAQKQEPTNKKNEFASADPPTKSEPPTNAEKPTTPKPVQDPTGAAPVVASGPPTPPPTPPENDNPTPTPKSVATTDEQHVKLKAQFEEQARELEKSRNDNTELQNKLRRSEQSREALEKETRTLRFDNLREKLSFSKPETPVKLPSNLAKAELSLLLKRHGEVKDYSVASKNVTGAVFKRLEVELTLNDPKKSAWKIYFDIEDKGDSRNLKVTFGGGAQPVKEEKTQMFRYLAQNYRLIVADAHGNFYLCELSE